MNKQYLTWWGNISLGVSAVIGLVCLLAAIMYSVPNAEDFALSNAPRFQGKIISIVNILCFFDSRYTANMLHAFNPLALGSYQHFFIIPLICFLLLLLAVRFFLGSILVSKKLWLLSLLLTCSYMALVPSLPFALFYMSSTFTYTYPCIFWLLWVGTLLRDHQWKTPLTTFFGLTFLILSFGSSELFIPINGITLLAALLLCFPANKERLVAVLPYCIIGVACLAFIYFMPSNKFSSEKIHRSLAERYEGSNFLFVGLKMYSSAWIRGIFSIYNLLLFCALTVVFQSVNFRPQLLQKWSAQHLAGLVVFVQFFSFLFMLPYLLSIGSSSEYPVRILNIVLFFPYIALFILLPYLCSRFGLPVFFNRWLLPITTLLLPLSVLASAPNFRLIVQELYSGKLAELYTNHQQLYSDIDSVKKCGKTPLIVEFPQMETPPASIWLHGDLLPNRENEDWNLAYEMYFQIDELRLPGDTIFKPTNTCE